jgi:D-3-phosphoglycerate dehydrogenase
MTTVLLSAPYMLTDRERFISILERLGFSVIAPEVEERLEEEQLLNYAGEFDGAICGDDRYTERVITACAPRLKVISKWGTGIDSIDQETCQRLGIMVGNTPNAFTLPVADSVLGYILSFARRLPWMDKAMKSGVWDKIPGRSLSECSLGVIGVGKVGQAVLRRADAFGMELLGNDIREVEPDFLAEHRVTMLPLQELLERADFVSLNCDLNPTSLQMIGEEAFQLMKDSAVLINTARGPVIDQAALVNALKNGLIAGAALDVFKQEPLLETSPLLDFENVMLAPHNSNSSPSAWERVHRNTLKNLLIGLGRSAADLEEVY